MSSYTRITKRPDTDKFEVAFWMDDMYGNHRYGVVFLDGTAYKADDHDWETKQQQIDNAILESAWRNYPKKITHADGVKL